MQHPVPVVSSPGNKGKLKSHCVLPVAPARKSDLQRNGVQIVITDGEGVSRCVMMERTDSMLDMFTILQHAQMVPQDVLPWDQGLSGATAAELRENRRSVLYDVGRLSADLAEVVLGPTPDQPCREHSAMRSRSMISAAPKVPQGQRPSFAMVYRELAQFMPVETLVQAQLLKDTDRGPQVVSLVGKLNWIRAFKGAQQKLVLHAARKLAKMKNRPDAPVWEELSKNHIAQPQALLQTTRPPFSYKNVGLQPNVSVESQISILSQCRRSSDLPVRRSSGEHTAPVASVDSKQPHQTISEESPTPLWQHHKQALDDTWDMDFAQPQSDRPDRTDPQLPRRSSDLLKGMDLDDADLFAHDWIGLPQDSYSLGANILGTIDE